MARSVAIIGAGQIGFAAASSFLESGWDVRVCARTRPAWLSDDIHFEQNVLGDAPSPSADVIFDTIAYDEDDVARFDPISVGRYIAISTGSVYGDRQGRGFETDPKLGQPEFPVPLTEDLNQIAPGPESYSSKKVRMENKAAAMFGERATLIRPFAIHGPHSRQPREWWLVKRILNGRKRVPLAFGGRSTFHTTSARSIGALAAFLADRDLGGGFNIVDETPPNCLTICETIAAHFGADIALEPFEGPPQSGVGATPWSLPYPVIASNAKAIAAGFDRIDRYDDSVTCELDWLRDQPEEEWKKLFPVLAGYPWDLFDYDAEDRFFAEQT